MELLSKGVLIHDLNNTEVFSINVNENNYKIIRKKLEAELNKIIDMFKILKEQGEIKSLSRPRNKKLQEQLNIMIQLRRTIKQSIKGISEMYYK